MKFFLLVAGSVLLASSVVSADCGDGNCSVGAFGTGGDSSGGKAQGFYYSYPSTKFPGETYSNSGNFDAGRLNVTNEGSTAGTGRDDIVRGHGTGIFGDFSGQCSFDDFEAGDC